MQFQGGKSLLQDVTLSCDNYHPGEDSPANDPHINTDGDKLLSTDFQTVWQSRKGWRDEGMPSFEKRGKKWQVERMLTLIWGKGRIIQGGGRNQKGALIRGNQGPSGTI